MRRVLILCLLLAACRMQAPDAEVAPLVDEEISVTTLEGGEVLPTEPAGVAPEVALPTEAAVALPTDPAGEAPEETPPTDAAVPVPPVLLSPEALACGKAGGQWAKAGPGNLCVKPTREGTKSCRKKSDCRGECLAQSGTCAPITPLMGCNEVLDAMGRRMTQCLQ